MKRITQGWTLLLLMGLLAGPTASGCGGRDWAGENAQLQSDLEEAREQLEASQRRITQLEGENGDMRRLIEARGSDMTALADQLRAAREREAAQQARLAAMRRMAQQFRDMVAAGQLRVRIVRGSMVVELPDHVLFDSGRAELRDAGLETLRRVAGILARVENRNFLVAGHTDNVPISGRRGRFASNWHLSTARGVAVVRFLAENGLPPERLVAAGYADTQPVASNDTPEGQAQNRRIEIIVMPNLDELPDLSGLENELPGSADPS